MFSPHNKPNLCAQDQYRRKPPTTECYTGIFKVTQQK